jgi:hypothetical protein
MMTQNELLRRRRQMNRRIRTILAQRRLAATTGHDAATGHDATGHDATGHDATDRDVTDGEAGTPTGDGPGTEDPPAAQPR